MAATTADRTEMVTVIVATVPFAVAASTTIYQYETVAINGSGYAVPVSNTSGLNFVGYSTTPGAQSNASGTAGAVNVNVVLIGSDATARYYQFDCSGATQSWVNSLVYFTDDHTVALSASNSIPAGRVIQLLSSTVVVVDAARQA